MASHEQHANEGELARCLDTRRSDWVIRLLLLITPNAFRLAVFYSLASLGGSILFSWLEGTLFPRDHGKNALLSDYQNLINFGVVLPVGVVLVVRFYRALNEGIVQLVRERVVWPTSPKESSTTSREKEFLAQVDRRFNPWGFYVWPMVISLAINLLIWLQKPPAQWNGRDGGFAAYWFRAFVILNYYVIITVVLKGIAASSVVRAIFEREEKRPRKAEHGIFDRVLRTLRRTLLWLGHHFGLVRGKLDAPHRIAPKALHPDGCGGLRPLGRIAMGLNHFLVLIAVYCVVLLVAKTRPLYWQVIPLSIAFGIVALYLFFALLSPAHEQMVVAKDTVRSQLSDEFEVTFSRLRRCVAKKDPLPVEDLQRIELLDRLYSIASRMPEWPFDIRTTMYLVSGILIPVAVGAAIEVMKRIFGL